MSVFEYDWGDTVRVTPTAPIDLRPGSLASICGMRAVPPRQSGGGETTENTSVASMLYLIEFGDGFSVEISEQLLEPVDERHDHQTT